MCIACSDKVVNAYHAEGMEFLLKVFNDPSYLETLTGLKQLYSENSHIEVFNVVLVQYVGFESVFSDVGPQ